MVFLLLRVFAFSSRASERQKVEKLKLSYLCLAGQKRENMTKVDIGVFSCFRISELYICTILDFLAVLLQMSDIKQCSSL